MISDNPGPSQVTLNALVFAAHQDGKQVVAHDVTIELGVSLSDSGTDILTHSPLDDILDDQMMSDMVA